MMVERAVILAGGRGTRLRPFTVAIPKPLVPVGDQPIVEIVIRSLAKHGISHVTLAINHMGDLIRAYFGDGRKFGVNLEYSLETEPLGTIAPLRMIKDLPEHFLVMNADVLSDLDIRAFCNEHVESGAIFSIAATRRTSIVDYGVLDVEQGKLSGFREKPSVEHAVSMGIYCVSRKILDFIPAAGPFGFDQLMLKLLETKNTVRVHVHDGYWIDIGRPSDYELAVQKYQTPPLNTL